MVEICFFGRQLNWTQVNTPAIQAHITYHHLGRKI